VRVDKPTAKSLLLAIIELGGYPNFLPLYQALGCEVIIKSSMRKALALMKRRQPEIVVAEFNFQSDFRDRTSSLESLMAVAQRLARTRVIVFYEPEFDHHLDKLRSRFRFFRTLAFPVNEDELREAVREAISGSAS
jgi:DNA-binding NtrC family response regulator